VIEIAAQYSFGVAGSARPFMREGWSHREPDFTWTEGTSSRIVLPYEEGSGQVVLEISLTPMLFRKVLTRQQLLIAVNGHLVADEMLLGECSLAVDVPAHALAGAGALDIQLDCPMAAVPVDIAMSADDRRLGVAVREMLVFRGAPRAAFTPRLRPPLKLTACGTEMAVRGVTGLSLPDLAACFASLGHNCEFGLAQREMGAEVLGLLRFGGIPVRKLIVGLDLGFDGLEAPDNLFTYLSDSAHCNVPGLHEWIVRDRRYETEFHTDLTNRSCDAASVVKTFHRHLGFLRRTLLEDLAAGRKIFVFQHPVIRSVAQIRPILNLLRSHGPNTLLFVVATKERPAGSVEQVEEDLLQGWTTRLAPGEDALNFDLPCWVSICANAYRLWRESGRGEV